jgi:photosystem II stability/assembly factor-like uncharacterized protein
LTSAIAVDPVSPNIIYVGTLARGVFKSVDGGDTWVQKIQGMKAACTWTVAIDPKSPNILYAGVSGGNGSTVEKSTDYGRTWSPMGSLAPVLESDLISLAIDPDSTNYLYAAVMDANNLKNSGIYRSTDSGLTWNVVMDSIVVLDLAIDPDTPNVIYAATWGVYKSTDRGDTWSESGLNFCPVYSLAIDPSSTNIVYAGTNLGVYKSTDWGGSWKLMGLAGETIRSVAVNPVSSNIIYAGTEAGHVFKSVNEGMAWERIDPGWDPAIVTSIVINPYSPNTIYVGRNAADTHPGLHGGVYRSTDGGTTWTTLDNGLDCTQINLLAIDPLSPNTIYAATYGGGVFSCIIEETKIAPPSPAPRP